MSENSLLEQLIHTIQANPLPFLAGAIVITLIALINSSGGKNAPKDPKRLFDAAQRKAGRELSSDQCERTKFFLFRCRGHAEHADHWIPHKRGGATSMENLVYSCSWHNLTKGAKPPTFWETSRIARRRKRYFPVGTPRRPGARYVPHR